MLTSFIFVPVTGIEPARLGSSIELHGILLTSTLVAVFALRLVEPFRNAGKALTSIGSFVTCSGLA